MISIYHGRLGSDILVKQESVVHECVIEEVDDGTCLNYTAVCLETGKDSSGAASDTPV
jgi:hypothetical protein